MSNDVTDNMVTKEQYRYLKDEVDRRLNRMDERLDRMDERLDRMDERLDRIEERAASSKRDWMDNSLNSLMPTMFLVSSIAFTTTVIINLYILR